MWKAESRSGSPNPVPVLPVSLGGIPKIKPRVFPLPPKLGSIVLLHRRQLRFPPDIAGYFFQVRSRVNNLDLFLVRFPRTAIDIVGVILTQGQPTIIADKLPLPRSIELHSIENAGSNLTAIAIFRANSRHG
jgi:hypothetical protein